MLRTLPFLNTSFYYQDFLWFTILSAPPPPPTHLYPTVKTAYQLPPCFWNADPSLEILLFKATGSLLLSTWLRAAFFLCKSNCASWCNYPKFLWLMSASPLNQEKCTKSWSIFLSSWYGISISGNTYVCVLKGRSETFYVSWNIYSENNNNKVSAFSALLKQFQNSFERSQRTILWLPSKSKYRLKLSDVTQILTMNFQPWLPCMFFKIVSFLESNIFSFPGRGRKYFSRVSNF